MEVAPSEWIPILKKSYQRLRQMGVGDLVVYGSQSLSLFLQTPLSSKNVDLAGSATLEHVVDLAKHLSPEERFEVRRVGRGYVYVVYAKTSAQRPIAVEIFTHTPLGAPSEIPDCVEEVERWGSSFWTITPQAYIACKLASPHPLTRRDAWLISSALELCEASDVVDVLRRRGLVGAARSCLERATAQGIPIPQELSTALDVAPS